MAVKRRNHWISTSSPRKRRRLVDRICCEICDDLFLSQSELRSHQYDTHKGNQWRCDHCCLELKFSRSDSGKYTHECERNQLMNGRLFSKTHATKEKYRSVSTMKSRSLIISNNGNPPFDNSQKNRRNPRQRVRMSRCGKCIGCNSKNCGKCYKCLDMVKYGGPGTLKQACEKRQCINPQMPDSSPSNSIKTSSKDEINIPSSMENSGNLPSKLAEQASAEIEDAHISSEMLGTLKLSSKKSAILPTTFSAYLALEAAAAKYAPKVALNIADIAQKEWWDNIEAATDPNEPKRKNFKKSKDLSFHESDDGTKENPYDFYKFAEQTAESIKDNGNRPHGIANSYSQPPRWLNRRPKITYSKMCKQAIQSSTNGSASLKSIYEYIMNNYPYYKELENPRGWQIAVRNTLKLNKAFVRQRTAPESRVGRQGNSWALDPKYATADGFKRAEFSVLDESIWDLNKDIYATVNSREAIYDSDDSLYKGENDCQEDDSDSDLDMALKNPASKFGTNFINGAVSAAESKMNQTPGRKLLSTIGAASKRHNNGLDHIRHNPLSEYLGFQNCELETNHYSNKTENLNDRCKNYRTTIYQNSTKSRNSMTRTQNCNTVEVPKLSLLASAALARKTFMARKPVRKRFPKDEDIVELQNVVFEPDLIEDIGKNVGDKFICYSCKTSGEPNTMLVCGVCQSYCHMFCLDDTNDNIPDGWSEETWNMLTDWNKCEDDDSNRKLCEIIKNYKEWICAPCSSKAYSFYGNNLYAVKTKIPPFSEETRKNAIKRDKGEVMIMASHFPTPVQSTELSFPLSQDSWKMIPNDVVADVSNIEIVILDNNYESVVPNQMEKCSSSDYKSSNSICESKMASVIDENIELNDGITKKKLTTKAKLSETVTHDNTQDDSIYSGQLSNKQLKQDKSMLSNGIMPSSSKDDSLNSSQFIDELKNKNEESRKTYILKEMNQNLTFGNGNAYNKDSEGIDKCDSPSSILMESKTVVSHDTHSDLKE